jgi:hypothetical protein
MLKGVLLIALLFGLWVLTFSAVAAGICTGHASSNGSATAASSASNG